MDILLNGEKEVLDTEKNIVDFLKGLDLNPDIVSVNLNGKLLGRDELSATILKDGDKIDVLLFMGGGC